MRKVQYKSANLQDGSTLDAYDNTVLDLIPSQT